MLRTAGLSLLPGILIASGWQQLEEPSLAGDFSFAATLAILAALVPRRGLRILAEVVAFFVVVRVAFGLSVLDALPFREGHFFGPFLSQLLNGIGDFYELALPFDPVERQRMHGAIVLAVFAFTSISALAIRDRRPVLATASMLAGAAWPVTLVSTGSATARGGALLVASLILFAALRPGGWRGSRQAALVGAAVLVTALVAVSSPAVAKGGFLDWQQWKPYARAAEPVSVQYVWDADYDGITLPKTPTTVLSIAAPRRAPYWRATTLDVFLDDHWQEDTLELPAVPDEGRDLLTLDPLLPPRAREPRRWMSQVVTVEALDDSHLVAASVPVAFERGEALAYSSGIAYTGRLHQGETYQAWSYVPQVTPADLTESKASYPPELEPFLAAGSGPLPPFGDPTREQALASLFQVDDEAAAYEPLYRLARDVVGRPRNPYAAAVALEAWFRTSGEFSYDESPPTGSAAPPLVAFATGHRSGYCQHFAGAMAVMLRYLGVPARVAVGFTTGRFDAEEGTWTVSDTNAHAWVEVWFDGYGWLPFDPTPGRGRLRGSYTASSLFFDANGATAAFAGVAVAAAGLDILRNRLRGADVSPDDRTSPLDPNPLRDTPGASTTTVPQEERDDVQIVLLIALAAAGLVGLLWLAKLARRRARYFRTEDPRRVASAVRAELNEYLADQRITLPSSATNSDLSAELWTRLRVDADPLARALGIARYGPAEAARGAAREARRELRLVLRTLRQRLTAKRRFLGLLSLRSLGLRA